MTATALTADYPRDPKSPEPDAPDVPGSITTETVTTTVITTWGATCPTCGEQWWRRDDRAEAVAMAVACCGGAS